MSKKLSSSCSCVLRPHLQTRWPRYLHSDEQEKIEDEMRNKKRDKRDRQSRVKKEKKKKERKRQEKKKKTKND